jgi:hypothetical protein
MTSMRISVYWPNGWVRTSNDLSRTSLAQWRAGIVLLEISNRGVVDPRQSRRQPLDLLRPPIDWMFSVCSHGAQECPDVDASQCSKKSDAETTALVEAEVAEAIASCGGDVRAALRATLIANAYLEAEIERLTEAISTGFARGRIRKAPQRITKI